MDYTTAGSFLLISLRYLQVYFIVSIVYKPLFNIKQFKIILVCVFHECHILLPIITAVIMSWARVKA